MMKTPHKHAAVIKAWADGAEIQHRPNAGWEWSEATLLTLAQGVGGEYRIKPEPKPDVVQYYRSEVDSNSYAVGAVRVKLDNLKLTFDGETGKLKSAEVV